MNVGCALIFGSWWALAVAVLIACLFIWRTAMEDPTLRSELPGYEAFAAARVIDCFREYGDEIKSRGLFQHQR